MKKKLLCILLMGILVIGLTGCENENIKDNSKGSNNNSKENNQVQDDITSNQNDSIEQKNESNASNIDDYYTGTYYMILVDGSLADDGTGTIILNKDKSCTYIYEVLTIKNNYFWKYGIMFTQVGDIYGSNC